MAIMDSIKKFIIPDIDEDDEIEVEEKSSVRQVRDEAPFGGVRKAKVVNINHGSTSRIVIAKLDSTAGVKLVINNLKERVPVVFSIARLDRNDAARVVDVVYGATYAVDGRMQKVSNDIFLITPYGIEITGDIAAELLDSADFALDL
ncbi:MAG: cell division protein SepF [Clostridia bacterium]|nr:cell division protein SepF [Clostridia bacterium]